MIHYHSAGGNAVAAFDEIAYGLLLLLAALLVIGLSPIIVLVALMGGFEDRDDWTWFTQTGGRHRG